MSSYKIEVAVSGLSLGEGPHWVEEKQELVYTDIPGQAVHRYVPSTGKDYFIPMGGRTTLVVPVESKPNQYVIAIERDLYQLEWNGLSDKSGSSLKKITSVENNFPKNRFNDGKCDPQGRLWAGTMGFETTPGNVDPEKGNLYKLGLDGKLTPHVDKIGISNGLAWSLDSTKFYYIDSAAYTVDVFDFNATEGTLSNRKVFYSFKKNGIAGLPDGMACDANNNIWVAAYTGSKVLHIDTTTGTKIGEINFEGRASKPTSVAFGGPNLDILYVTSAQSGLTANQLASEPDAGAVFKVTNIGAKGKSGGVPFKGKLDANLPTV